MASALALARERADDHRRIMVVQADGRWEAVLYNWVLGCHRLGLRNYLVITVDQAAAARLRRQGAPALLVRVRQRPYERTFVYHQGLWASRWRVIHGLVRHGFDVLHADADAPLLRDPRPLFELPADLVGSRDVPKKEWLFCMG